MNANLQSPASPEHSVPGADSRPVTPTCRFVDGRHMRCDDALPGQEVYLAGPLNQEVIASLTAALPQEGLYVSRVEEAEWVECEDGTQVVLPARIETILLTPQLVGRLLAYWVSRPCRSFVVGQHGRQPRRSTRRRPRTTRGARADDLPDEAAHSALLISGRPT